MNCEQLQERLNAYLDGELTPEVQAAARSHLAGCSACSDALKGLERAMGRVERERWGPREIDLDLLLFGDDVVRLERVVAARSDDPAKGAVQWLEVPHPAAAERLFVLAPLADVAPELVPPGWGRSVEAARSRAETEEGASAVEPVAEWDFRGSVWRDLP